MYVINDVTLIYDTGATVVLDNVIEFEIKLGNNAEASWSLASWSKTRPMILGFDHIVAVYRHPRRIWNPFKCYEIYKASKKK